MASGRSQPRRDGPTRAVLLPVARIDADVDAFAQSCCPGATQACDGIRDGVLAAPRQRVSAY